MITVDLLTSTQERRKVSFFDDDTIDVVRQRIGTAVDIHPDRLQIQVALRLPRGQYTSDPRRWERLYARLSLNGQPIPKETWIAYVSELRIPAMPTLAHTAWDHEGWMNHPEELANIQEPAGDFTEYRILGVEEIKSYTLPLTPNARMTARVPSAQAPIPEPSTLISTLQDVEQIQGFYIREQNGESDEGTEQVYFPFFRSTTPPRLSLESIQFLNQQTQLLQNLVALDAPPPKTVHILRARWKVPWISTDLGDAIRTRLEQMFQGLTVSKETPVVVLYTSSKEVSRIKFFTENPKTKKPHLDPAIFASWWNSTKPSRNIPMLVVYRGTKTNQDRLAISGEDLIASIYRDDTNTEDLETSRDELQKWFESLDAVIPFVNTMDLPVSRWELQDVRAEAKYTEELSELSFLRYNCIQPLFDRIPKKDTAFRILRTDHANVGIPANVVKILQLRRDNPFLKPSELAAEMQIRPDEAAFLLKDLEARLEDDPNLEERAFRNFPTIVVTNTGIAVDSIRNLEHALRQANILRQVLSDPDHKPLDKVCPRRLQASNVDSSVVPTRADVGNVDNLDELFDFLQETEEVKEEVTEEKAEPKVRTAAKVFSRQGYYEGLLKEFDPDSFDFKGSKYSKLCDQKLQPVVVADEDLEKILDEQRPESLPEDRKLDWEDPDGTLMCPAYWCMQDRIPLEEDQLVEVKGDKACPVCKGRLRNPNDETSNIRDFPLIQRSKIDKYPGLKKDKLPNGKNMPCCYKTSQVTKIKSRKESEGKEQDEKQQVVGENKRGLKELRFAYLPQSLLSALHIKEDQNMVIKSNSRLQTGVSGQFRIGLGRPSQTLPLFFKLTSRVPPPRDRVDVILTCSFVRTWKVMGDSHLEEIEKDLEDMSGFSTDPMARKQMARVISGIDEAFAKGELKTIEELEQTAVALQIDLFRIRWDEEQPRMMCMFFTPITIPRRRGLILLQRENEQDALVRVIRLAKSMDYKANVFEAPFKEETQIELEKLRNTACKIDIPDRDKALKVLKILLKDRDVTFEVILDPYGRGQAFLIPGDLILPFYRTSVTTFNQNKRIGFQNVSTAELPPYTKMRGYLVEATQVDPGYAWGEDVFDSAGNRVEILTRAGLRIPVQPEPAVGEPGEVWKTLQSVPESTLAFAEPNAEDQTLHRQITYASEVQEFLLFQLTQDLKGGDYRLLRDSLQEFKPKRSAVETLLQSWFEETAEFVNLDKPLEFLSKIRRPCGQLTKAECTGNLCGWNGKVCRLQVRDTLSKGKLFNKLLSNLIENPKLRAIVLEGRMTPFFSTVLYLELPNEVIYTETELKDEK